MDVISNRVIDVLLCHLSGLLARHWPNWCESVDKIHTGGGWSKCLATAQAYRDRDSASLGCCQLTLDRPRRRSHLRARVGRRYSHLLSGQHRLSSAKREYAPANTLMVLHASYQPMLIRHVSVVGKQYFWTDMVSHGPSAKDECPPISEAHLLLLAGCSSPCSRRSVSQLDTEPSSKRT